MELKEFLESFSDFKQKIKEIEKHKGIAHDTDILIFIRDNFSQMLEDYTEKICEKQRENCAKKIYDIHIPKREQDVLNAEQPKIE